MKRAFNILLIISFAFVAVGHVFIFTFQEYKIKKEMKRAILKNMPDSDLKSIIISKAHLNADYGFKKIHSREFKLHGEMYDIVREYDLKDSVKYICIHDKDETALIAGFVNYCNSDKTNSPIKKQIKQFNIDFFKINIYENEPLYESLKDNIISKEDYSFQFNNVESPPPEFLV